MTGAPRIATQFRTVFTSLPLISSIVSSQISDVPVRLFEEIDAGIVTTPKRFEISSPSFSLLHSVL